jgi:hypothetical protein
MSSKNTDSVRPLNVVVGRGSRAEKVVRTRGALPGGVTPQTDALVPGVKPTPAHDLVFHGGKTIRDLVFTNLYVGGQHAWKVSDIHHIDKALVAAMADPQLNNVMVQYFPNQQITSRFVPSQVLPGSKPVVVSGGDVEKLVKQLYVQGHFTGSDLVNTVFNFVLPSGTVLTTDDAPTHVEGEVQVAAAKNPVKPEDAVSSLEGLGGFHGSVHVSAHAKVYYAVGVYSETLTDGTDNGIVAFDHPWKNVVATFYHELQEARTDADVEDAIRAGNDPKAVKFLGWMSRFGEECGDFPMTEVGSRLQLVMKEVHVADGSVVPVQFQYSNAVHGPEGQIAAPHVKKTHTHTSADRRRA